MPSAETEETRRVVSTKLSAKFEAIANGDAIGKCTGMQIDEEEAATFLRQGCAHFLDALSNQTI